MRCCLWNEGLVLKCLWEMMIMMLLLTNIIIQTGAVECNDFIEGGEYTVTKEVVELVKGNLQQVVDCVPNEGVLKFDNSLTLSLEAAIELNRPILLSSNASAQARPVLQCKKEEESLFDIRSPGVTLHNLVITNCSTASNNKSAIVIDIPRRPINSSSSNGGVVLEDVKIMKNVNAKGPGGVLIRSATSVSLTNVTFEDNMGLNGGAMLLEAQNVQVQIDRCSFRGNSASSRGGALAQKSSADVVIAETEFYGNDAMLEGGAYSIEDCSVPNNLAIFESVLDSNAAASGAEGSSGGAVAACGSPLSFILISSMMSNNTATLQGGAVKISNPHSTGGFTADITHTILEGNTAIFGGAIYAEGMSGLNVSKTTLSLHNSTFQENIAKSDVVSGRGGAMYVRGSSLELTVAESRFRKNSVFGASSPSEDMGARGGAVFVEDMIRVSVKDSVFNGNVAKPGLGHSPAGGAMFFMETGVNKVAQVKGGPDGSECSDQCDPTIATGPLGIQGSVGGCGRREGVWLCALRDATKCERINKTTIAAVTAAECEVVALRGEVNISGSLLALNEAGEGGAIGLNGLWDLSLQPGNAISENVASVDGGALVVGDGSKIRGENLVFSANKAGRNGGAVFLKGGESQIALVSSVFMGNEARKGSGGAVMVNGAQSHVRLGSSTILMRNTARRDGGAVFSNSPTARFVFREATFEENLAGRNGGAFYAKVIQGQSQVFLTDVKFLQNMIQNVKNFGARGHGLGGAMVLHGTGIQVKTRGGLEFLGNEAREGGAVRLIDTGPVSIFNALFENNSGLSGGAIHATFTTHPKDYALSLENTTFRNNTAFMGGALMADAQTASEGFVQDDPLAASLFHNLLTHDEPQVALKNIKMVGQSVVKEGAGMLLIGTIVFCDNCSLGENTVHATHDGAGGGISLKKAAVFDVVNGELYGNSAVYGGGISIEDSVFKAKKVEFMKNAAHEKGGAAYLSSQDRGGRNPVQSLLNLKTVSLRRNTAKFGAGVYGDIRNGHGRDRCSVLRDMSSAIMTAMDLSSVYSEVANVCNVPRSLNTNAVSHLRLTDVEIRDNVAQEAGGAIFVNDPEAVCACCGRYCSESCKRPVFAVVVTLPSVCSRLWTNNVVRNDFGPNVATGPVSANVVSGSGRSVNEGDLLVDGHNSGDVVEAFKVRLLDFSRNLVAEMRSNVFVEITSNVSRILAGQREKKVVGGVAEFSGLILSAPPGIYAVRIKILEDLGIAEQEVKIRVRECQRGEESVDGRVDNEFRCVRCGARSVNFNPEGNCEPCPENALCDGKSIVPNDGYWQSTSWSSKIQKCPTREACSYSDRKATLMHVSESSEMPVRYDANTGLCRQGYEGILCGSCSEGYGHICAFECKRCWSKVITIVTIVLVSVWTILVCCFLTANALASGRVIRTVTIPMEVSNPVPVRSEAVGECEITVATSSSMTALEAEERTFSLSVNPMVEGIKILVNFLQVTSIALALDNEWRTELKILFKVEDVMSGVSTRIGIASIDCAMGGSPLIPSVQRSVISLMLPWGTGFIMAFLCLIQTFFRRKSRHSFRDRVIVSVLVIAFLFYTEVTEQVLQIFTRVSADAAYHNMHSEATTKIYWAGDTTLGYFEDTHLYLALFMGLPYLFFFSIGFPFALFAVLRCNLHRWHHEDFSGRYGFLYKAYNEEHVYWELAVILRKAVLVGITVFGYPLGSNLQSYLILSVLFIALIIHLLSQPYREEISRLNRLEAFSLSTSFFTYLVGVVLKDDHLTTWPRHVLVASVLFLTLLFVMLLCAHFIVGIVENMEKWVEEQGIDIPTDASLALKLKIGWECVWNSCMSRFWDIVERRLSLPPTGRPLPWNNGVALSSARSNLAPERRIRI